MVRFEEIELAIMSLIVTNNVTNMPEEMCAKDGRENGRDSVRDFGRDCVNGKKHRIYIAEMAAVNTSTLYIIEPRILTQT